MAESKDYDLIVIGGGPAGYAAAIRAGQLGKKVACVEMESAGGTCLNWGCIPTKALLKSAELYLKMKKADEFGISAGEITFDFAKVMERSRGVAGQMAKGIEFLFKKNKVDYIRGKGQVSAPGMVSIVEGKDMGQFLKAKNILIATGCKMRRIPGLEVDGERVMTSREALANKKLPKSIVIVGAGAIGVEFAYFYNAFGTDVTLVEMLPNVLPIEDNEISKTLERSFEKQGIKIRTGTKCENFQVGKDTVKLDLVKGGEKEEIEAEVVLSAIGVVANIEGVLAANVKVALDRDYVKVGDDYQTNVKGIYAAGDIIGPPWLAHIATFEAVQAVNGMFGHGKPKRVGNFPGCTYCQPQVSSTGLTEQAAKEKKLDYKVGKFPFTASGKAVASGAAEGFVKVITDKKTGEIYGAHIIGAEATELIAEYGFAMDLEATVEDIHHTIHAHPTLSEAVMEAAAASLGEAIHI
ncbi:dihydrolipoyl dehydrogenase [Synoicihabitans lomoniglobus]|uniref:Dihydrolipoyl dehydrogenase n=1 Tax=Synoicihabitans lomoniglobus TaxID=2909285 RepID=A0AAF0CQN4_9BACT|nr:dihydrolipoyl dehydrogenase [Opitutaceae bacterium LMO-M01]WED66294.1 dihydrolipoyl dehydrogenase [Opitutaceae bacterium LMO-M01]